jgi:RNA polymerase sigma-70 factor (ECF subfamily)
VRGALPRPATSEFELDEEERRLIDAVRAGDAEVALPLLMGRYQLTVYRYCRRMLGNDADGDEVSQIVFQQSLDAIQRRAQVQSMRAWLIGIARNRCIDRLRRRRRAPLLVDDAELERIPDPEDPPLGDPRAREVLDACLDKLEARTRAVVLLRFYDDLTYDDISELTGDTPGALRVRVSRALVALRRCMERKGEAP